jgi:hypothetical protein
LTNRPASPFPCSIASWTAAAAMSSRLQLKRVRLWVSLDGEGKTLTNLAAFGSAILKSFRFARDYFSRAKVGWLRSDGVEYTGATTRFRLI